jgi:hypothetical protein
MVDAQWTATRPFGYHLTNTLLHLAAAWLFLLVVRRLGFSRDLSLAAAAMLVAHPLLTSAVAWIPGRGDSLLAVWFLTAMLSLLRWLEDGDRRSLLTHAGLVLVALFTKEAAAALPFVFAGFLLVGPHWRKLKDPGLWMAWGLPLLTWYVLRRMALASVGEDSLLAQLGELGRHLSVLLMFLGKAVWPEHLSVLAFERDTPWLAGAIATVPIALAFYWLEGAQRRLFLWGLSSFVLLLLPSLAVSDFLILEIRSYAPLVGLLVTPVILKRYYYAYDPAGDRLAEQIDDAVTGATYNNMNQLVSQQAGGALVFKGTVSEPANVTVGGKPATVTADDRFEGQAVVPGGTGQVAVTATDPQAMCGRTRTK